MKEVNTEVIVARTVFSIDYLAVRSRRRSLRLCGVTDIELFNVCVRLREPFPDHTVDSKGEKAGEGGWLEWPPPLPKCHSNKPIDLCYVLQSLCGDAWEKFKKNIYKKINSFFFSFLLNPKVIISSSSSFLLLLFLLFVFSFFFENPISRSSLS